ncbi:MAG: hypothetical protein IKC82_01830 [Lentisphaeria bacterium]|nr:hypothetical protein [Lentisphaeria bacterium]
MDTRGTDTEKNKDEKLLAEVEEALFRRATGYEDAAGKVVPPDVRAAMYWLENRFPERWKKIRAQAGDDGGDKSLTDEEKLL